jgi:hypothetical protein
VQRRIKAGWDMCILSAGASGVFSSPDLMKSYSYFPVTLALMSLLLSIGIAVIIMRIRLHAGVADVLLSSSRSLTMHALFGPLLFVVLSGVSGVAAGLIMALMHEFKKRSGR